MDLIGAFVTDISQVDEVKKFSSAVGFKPDALEEFTGYLNAIDNELIAVPVVDDYFYHDTIGEYTYVPKTQLVEAINNSSYTGRIVFMFDEPFWRVRNHHSDNRIHEQTFETLTQIINDYDEFEFAHIEAYAELYKQQQEFGAYKLLLNAKHIGFDCYGGFYGCSDREDVPLIPQETYLYRIYASILEGGSNAELFLVPGISNTLTGDAYVDDEELLTQFYEYINFYNNHRHFVSGIGAFTWGDYNVTMGARNSPAIRAVLKHEFQKLT
jgi:hypothetical protein